MKTVQDNFLKSVNQLLKKVDKIERDIYKSAVSETQAMGEEIKDESIKLINEGPRTGRAYRRNGISRRRSAPGEPPKTDTGRLVRSIRSITLDSGKSAITEVGTNLKYGAYLQYGTAKMRPRPWLSVTFRHAKKKTRARMTEAFRKVIQRHTI